MDTAPQGSLSDVLQHADGCWSHWKNQSSPSMQGKKAWLAAEAEWKAAVLALNDTLRTLPRLSHTDAGVENSSYGFVLSGPLPVLSEVDPGQPLDIWITTPQPLADVLNGRRSLLPSSGQPSQESPIQAIQALPLTLQNPLLRERFCLVVTPTFSVGLVLGHPTGNLPCLQYSFDPQVLMALLHHVSLHVSETVVDKLSSLEAKASRIITAPDYRLVTRFTRVLLANLPHRFNNSELSLEGRGNVRLAHWSNSSRGQGGTYSMSLNGVGAALPTLDESSFTHGRQDTELLQAMAHEIRTPLTTIRTLTRSLLRRKDFPAEVRKRLGSIDQECTQQIDRFNLIFRAVELETTKRDRPHSSLAPIALTQILQDSIPRWQQQARRRNLSLEVALPSDLPKVTSDPTLLNQLLTGVVELFTQYSPAQSHIQMSVTLAGHQLKLQFEAEPQGQESALNGKPKPTKQPLKALGQVLMVAPETGSLSLNLDVTKNLFQFLGGKLIVRQCPKGGEVLTAFLPLDTREV